MSTAASTRPRTRVRALLSAALSALLVGAALLGAAPAQAATSATLDNVYFESQTFADGSRQSLHVDWSIPDGSTDPVTLSLELPAELRGYADSFAMLGPGGENAGTCVVSSSGVECTLDPAFVRNNPYGVSGEFWFDVSSQLKNKEQETHTFDFGGFSETVVVDPNRNWCTDNCVYAGDSFSKWGSYDNATDTIIWSVRVPAGAQGIDAGQSITVTDELDASQFELVTGNGYPRVREGVSVSYNEWDRETVDYATKPADEVDWSADNLTATFTSIAGAGQDAELGDGARGTDGSFYIVQWQVKVLDGGKARTYTNSANYSIDGGTSGSTNGSATRYSGGATAVGQNFGRFQVTKDLQGDTVLNPTFTVEYEAYDGDELIDSGSFDIRNGQSFTSAEYFMGTRIVLTEVEQTAPANVTWAQPRFVDADGNAVDELTFSAENGNIGHVTEITLVNDATLRTGELTASKVVDNPDDIDLDIASYRVNFARENAVDRGIQNITGGGFTLPADGTAVVVDLPGDVGYSFFEPFIPAPAGTTWADPVYTVNGVEVAENELVNLPVDGSIDLVVTNRITQNVGGFRITKSVSGEGESLVPEGAEFEVSYTYTSVNGFPAGEGTVTVTAGEPSRVVDDIPAGAEVTLTEVTPRGVEGGTWGEPQFDVSTFTVTTDGVVEVSLDNPISWNSGDFSVVKEIDGTGADLVADDVAFTVDYTYTIPEELGIEPATGEGSLTVRNDGEAVFGDELPFGTVIELTEAAPAAISGGEWTAAEFDQSSITIGDETTVAVTLTNTFDADSTSGALPRTGMEPWVLIAAPIGAALIALGVVLAVRRRRVS